MYKQLIRPLLFRCDPERIHEFTLRLLSWELNWRPNRAVMRSLFHTAKDDMPIELLGCTFRGRVGMAAGFDKHALLCDRLSGLGFAFMEMGTVTPEPQPGNPKPRLFRLPADKAVINRMGFNSKGVAYATRAMQRKGLDKRRMIPVAGNIGKNSATPNEAAYRDYETGLRALYPYVDFFVVNVSCPNVKDLCALQGEKTLAPIIDALVAARAKEAVRKPILLKLGPDASAEELQYSVRIALEREIDGFVVSNTTTQRNGLNTPQERIETIGRGGLSGRPLHAAALRAVRTVREAAGRGVPIIGVGGIFSPEDALAMLQAGASLIEVYTGMIYEGPGLVRRINRYLKQHQEEIPQW